MTLIQTLVAKLEALGVAIADEAKVIGALILSALERAGKGAEDAIIKDIPSIEAALKSYAAAEVEALMSNPAFKNAVGTWNFGTACALVLQAAERDFPALEALGKGLLQGAIETAVQGAFAALTTGNPTSPSVK